MKSTSKTPTGVKGGFITSINIVELENLLYPRIQENKETKKVVIKTNISKKDSAIRAAATALRVPEETLRDIFYIECRGNFKAEARSTGAYGCIQFMPSTLKRLGTSTEEFKKFEDYKQLPYVEEYFRRWKCVGKDLTTMYFCVFFPIARNKPDDWVLQSSRLSPNSIAEANKGFDLNKDGVLTVGEVKRKIHGIVRCRKKPNKSNKSNG